MPSLGSWRRLSPWFTQVNKHPLLLGLGLGLVGLGLNLFPLSLTEGISLYLGLIPAILPAVTHGLASGLISCGIAALAFLSRPGGGFGSCRPDCWSGPCCWTETLGKNSRESDD